MATVKKTTDKDAIKVMIAELSDNAIQAISAKSTGPLKGLGSPSASQCLCAYAKRHAELLDAQAEASVERGDAKVQAAAARKVTARLKKFEELHNYLVCKPASDKYMKKLHALKQGASAAKIQETRKLEELEALAARGIGDKQVPKR